MARPRSAGGGSSPRAAGSEATGAWDRSWRAEARSRPDDRRRRRRRARPGGARTSPAAAGDRRPVESGRSSARSSTPSSTARSPPATRASATACGAAPGTTSRGWTAASCSSPARRRASARGRGEGLRAARRERAAARPQRRARRATRAARSSRATGERRTCGPARATSATSVVRARRRRFPAREPRLDVLVNNAGRAAAPSARCRRTGSSSTFATNVLAPFLLTKLLTRRCAQRAARIVNVSSGGMYTAALDVDDLQTERAAFDGAAVYARTKRARGGAHRAVGRAAGRQRRRRARDAPRLGRHAGRADLAADVPQGHRAVPARRPSRAPTRSSGSAPPASRRAPRGGSGTTAARARRTACPWTKESPQDRERLWRECARMTGWTDPATTGAA